MYWEKKHFFLWNVLFNVNLEYHSVQDTLIVFSEPQFLIPIKYLEGHLNLETCTKFAYLHILHIQT